MKEILSKLVDGNNLTKEEAMHAQELILTGQVTPAQIACFLTALRMKGETLDEITDLQVYCAIRHRQLLRRLIIM